MSTPSHLHFVGIGGRAMGGIAIALSRRGHRVTGSDEGIYEPMSGCLRRAGIHANPRYAANNLPPDTSLAVVGKRVREDNPELSALLHRGIPFQSFPAFLHDQFLCRARNAVVAGGLGKTTTTAMLTWILEHAGVRPDYLIGGVARNLADSARFEGAAVAVLEGDEYASCFDDLRPKFLHYAPSVAVITNLFPDHPDLYPDSDGLLEAFRALVRALPPDGRLMLPADDPVALQLAAGALCPVVTVGVDARADRAITAVCLDEEGCRFHVAGAAFTLPMCGAMNMRNAAMAVVAAEALGVPSRRAAEALALFRGVVHRQDATEVAGCTLVTDKASHPHSLRELHLALAQRYPARRQVVVIQPRATGGREWIYQRELPAVLARFDKVILTGAHEHDPPARTAWSDDPFSIEALAAEILGLSGEVRVVRHLLDTADVIGDEVQAGDVVLVLLREQFIAQTAAIEAALLTRHAAV